MVDAKGIKIMIVCTFGAGSSVMLKMAIDNAIAQLGVENVITEVCDSGSCMGNQCDAIVTTTAHKELVKSHPTAKSYGVVKGMFDTDGISTEMKRIFQELGIDV